MVRPSNSTMLEKAEDSLNQTLVGGRFRRLLLGTFCESRTAKVRETRCLHYALSHPPMMTVPAVIALIAGIILGAINQGNVI